LEFGVCVTSFLSYFVYRPGYCNGLSVKGPQMIHTTVPQRYGLEFMSGEVVNGNREKQVFMLAKVGYVSNVNGSEKLHYGSRFSKKVDINR
jgi:hypothetical protein